MKILHVLQDWLHPPDHGQKLAVFNVLRYMSERHECETIGFVEGGALVDRDAARRDLPAARSLGVFPQLRGGALLAARLWRVGRLEPPSLARYDDAGFRTALRELARRTDYDLVHFHIMSIAHHVAAFSGCSSPTVLSALDAYSMSAFRAARYLSRPRARLKAALLARLIDRHERRWYPRFSKVHVVSEIDRQYLAHRNPEIDACYIPFAISQDYFDPPTGLCVHHDFGPGRLLYSGWLSSPEVEQALLEFLDGAYGDVVRRFPGTELTVIGRDARPALVRRLESTPGLRFVPYVPDYLSEAARCTAFVYPFAGGSGVKTKVLQAMALRKPVVASPDAFDGIAISPGVEALVCGSPSEFREALMRLLSDASLRLRLGEAGREYALRNHSLAVTGARMESLYAAAIEKSRRRRAGTGR